ncbi:MAG: bifunctional tetrahydrofolate synthase/dihydrofolate synthase [Betaproteobacteria bacterium]|jgi:dihydrofolate synthase/folylpolyglutamate synthase|nr:bifunctional tetrahydrofolate synthase/dihydrofolate synthase [Betaproteobacteria bacterium]
MSATGRPERECRSAPHEGIPAGRPATLSGWLAYLETLHPKAIAMGLERVRAVAARLGSELHCPVITVAGTNGKGSTCAMLASVLRCGGYRVGLYTSPHLLRYNERMRLDGRAVDDDALVAAFNAVEDARLGTDPVPPLTQFEFGTLAALWLFARAAPDAVILEVGLGGRLDAVNIVDADVAVVTTVDLDHLDYLGPTRESIGREKAGIFRAGRPAVCGDAAPPATLVEHAREIGAPLLQIGRDYGYVVEGTQWQYHGPGGRRFGLAFPALRGAYQLANAATVLAALGLLGDRLPLPAAALRDGLLAVELPGRFQVLPGRPTLVLDVGHNPQAARALAAALGTMGYHPRSLAVFGMLADKDIAGVVAALQRRIDRWHVATLPGPRGASAATLRAALVAAGVAAQAIHEFDDVAAALAAAQGEADEADRIIVFGSFLTVAGALVALRRGIPD